MEKKVPPGTVREFRGKQSAGWIIFAAALPLCVLPSLVLYPELGLILLILSAPVAWLFLPGIQYAKESRDILFLLSETELAVFWKGREWRYPREQLTVVFYAPKQWISPHHDIICSMGDTKDRFPDLLGRDDSFELRGLITRTQREEEEKAQERFLPTIARVLNGDATEYALCPEHRARACLRLHSNLLLLMGMPLVFGVVVCLFTQAPFTAIAQGVGVQLFLIPLLSRGMTRHSPSAFTLWGLFRYRIPSCLRLDMDGLRVNGRQIPFASVSSVTLGISSFDRQRQNSFVLLLRRRKKPIAPNITLRLGIAFEDGDPDTTIFPDLEEFIAVLSAVCRKRTLPFKVMRVDHPLAARYETYPKGFPH